MATPMTADQTIARLKMLRVPYFHEWKAKGVIVHEEWRDWKSDREAST